MHGRIPGFLADRRYWLLPLLPWTTAIVWSAQKNPAQAVVHLLTLVVCGGLLEQLRRCWLELDARKDEVDTLGRQLLQSERMVSLGCQVAGFAHEINTPIGIAVGAITNCEETLDGIERMLDGDEVSEQELRAALSIVR